jgi:hypothetical protein
MRRLLGGMALATAVIVALTGCSLWHDGEKIVAETQQGIAAAEALSTLTEELRARDDVESAESRVVSIFRTASVTVELRDTATAAAIAEITARVDEALRSEELQPFDREFSVHAAGAGIRQTAFDGAPTDYVAELSYWEAVRSIVGAGIDLTLGADRAGDLQRILSTQADAVVAAIAEHHDELGSLPAPPGAETDWRMPGILGYADWLGPLPKRGVLDVMAAMADATNLLDDSVQEAPPGVDVVLPGREQSFPPRFALVANTPGERVDATTTRQLTLRMARAALDAGLPAFQLAVQSYGADSFSDANLHVGDCADAAPPTAADRRLVAELTASGIRLADDAAGICVEFATP